ncbi:unnamed protein product [Acanthoscelides obtectus]|uniref:MADF domain-containing protein n=1 Tax=Acanthoscelides obtectus TaxID=200917 RepID=A0A9P0P7T8_ACAOB|nr:unnamed protein product [Acanthoscelides obtectus]CAK1672642.1 hypothetical protein AOBTE_LOCUS29009 [Acanthoscelides obtectus]
MESVCMYCFKKLNSLRTTYNKEKKKVEDSKRYGASADAVYEPKLWYYKELSFINDQHSARASISTIDDKEEETDGEQQIEHYTKCRKCRILMIFFGRSLP